MKNLKKTIEQECHLLGQKLVRQSVSLSLSQTQENAVYFMEELPSEVVLQELREMEKSFARKFKKNVGGDHREVPKPDK